MDCEKFESTLIDELYDELDELTSAASKRHVAGCARCAGLFSGLAATRRVAVLEMMEPPAGLEERVLAAAREARKIVPLRGRISHVVSWAGSWAMRPQTAMAAVFLLMIGSSVLLVRSGRQAKAPLSTASTMVVTEKGAPAAAAAPEEQQDNLLIPSSLAQAHGAFEVPKAAPAPAAAASGAMGTLLANKDDSKTAGSLDSVTEGSRGAGNAAGKARSDLSAPMAGNAYARAAGDGVANAAPPAGASMSVAKGAAATATAAPPSQAVVAPSEPRGTDFASGKAAFNAKNYDEAARIFDGLAASGDTNAALWGARTVRQSTGCAAAAPRFDQVGARAYGTPAGYDAILEGGQCYRMMGSFDVARNHFARLLTVPTHAARAQSELDAMSPRQAQGGVMRSQTKAAPAKPASPKASAIDESAK